MLLVTKTCGIEEQVTEGTCLVEDLTFKLRPKGWVGRGVLTMEEVAVTVWGPEMVQWSTFQREGMCRKALVQGTGRGQNGLSPGVRDGRSVPDQVSWGWMSQGAFLRDDWKAVEGLQTQGR